jgi:hypothetical protein
MEFEAAARRLARDHSKLKPRDHAISQKAKREADYRKQQQERLRLERERRQKQEDYMHSYMTSCDRALGVKSFSPNSFEPTSIHGDGDKIALPPSVLQHLSEAHIIEASSPWTFRVGVLRPDYKFPASPLLQILQEPNDVAIDDESDDEEREQNNKAAYVDELSHKYTSYTYATVVEFTQEEGHVGLPASIAEALLVDGVAATRTQDPAGDDDNAIAMDTNHDEEKTPGHLAWGAFDIPGVEVEVTLLKLPKGRRCTLVPTMEAIRNGFHNLKDIKLVLEQSLIRTRATLSVNDRVHTWHRGIKYDLKVASVTPSDYQSVSIINTDMEVDIGINEEFEREMAKQDPPRKQESKSSFAPGKGHTLSSSTSAEPKQSQQASPPTNLLPEPPLDQTEGICTVQIRAQDGATGRRRFDVTSAKLQDLFAFAASLVDVDGFRLVTRFPRQVFELTEASTTLADAGIGAGQEMFILERI